jgi:hypothetical protein
MGKVLVEQRKEYQDNTRGTRDVITHELLQVEYNPNLAHFTTSALVTKCLVQLL